MGRIKGKTDQRDAYRICKYALRNVNDYAAFVPQTDTMAELQSLEGQRKRLLKTCNQLAVPLAEERQALPHDLNDVHQYTLVVVDQIRAQLKIIDRQVRDLINRDPQFKRNYDIVTSIPGIGPVAGRRLLLATNHFTTGLQSRRLASHLGVAPFARQSGRCLNRNPSSGSGGKKTLKGVMYMGMLSITKGQTRLGRYYQRKIAEGKPHNVVMNNLINKVIHTIIACVREDVFYSEKHVHSLA